MSSFRSLALLLCLIAPATPLAAQQPAPDTVDVQAAWLQAPATLQSLTDPTVAAALLPAQLRTDARLRPRNLAATLDTAASLSYGWAYNTAWGGFALARALQAEHGSCGPIDSVTTRHFRDWCRRTFDAYLGSLERDSSFAPTIIDLDLIIPYPRLWASPSYEQAAVEGALLRGGLSEEIRERLERLQVWLLVERGDEATALEALTTAPAGVVTAGERKYLAAVLNSMLGNPDEATRLYAQAGLNLGPGMQLDWLVRDVGRVGVASESLAFVALPAAQRQAWLEAFWFDRDFVDGYPPGTRFAEHSRRWRTVLDRYRLFKAGSLLRLPPPDVIQILETCRGESDLPGDIPRNPFCSLGGSDPRSRLLDDRGEFFLRHGEPQQKANYPALQQLSIESWLYTLRERPAILHFRSLGNPEEVGMIVLPLSTGDWITTCQLAALYCVLDAQKTLKSLSEERIVRVQQLASEDWRFLKTSDGSPQRFEFKLPMAAAAIGLGKQPGVARIVADVSLRDLVAHATEDSTKLALRWQLRIRNTAKEWVVSLDTIRRYRLPVVAKGAPADGYLTVMLEVPVPAGTHEVKLVLSDTTGTIGAEYSRAGMVVEDPSASMGLSDLILLPDGEQGAATSIEGTPVRLSPALTPGRAKFVGIGYLISGAAGRDVPVSVTVTQIGKESEPPVVKVEFVEHPSTARAFRTQRVGIAELPKGAYTLEISAELVPGTPVVRRQLLVVR